MLTYSCIVRTMPLWPYLEASSLLWNYKYEERKTPIIQKDKNYLNNPDFNYTQTAMGSLAIS